MIVTRIHFDCPECPWKERKSCTVPSVGPTNSPLMFVGRNPGVTEDKRCEPFVGKSGDFLSKFLIDLGLDRLKVYIANTAKCYGGSGDPCPTEDVFNTCEPLISQEISLVKPVLIIPLGFEAYRRLTRDTSPITQVQGRIKIFPHQRDRRYFPLTHPSYWARSGTYYERVIKSQIVPVLNLILKRLDIFEKVKLES